MLEPHWTMPDTWGIKGQVSNQPIIWLGDSSSKDPRVCPFYASEIWEAQEVQCLGYDDVGVK